MHLYRIGRKNKKNIFFFLKNKIKKGDRVFLLSNNRIEWVEFDLAIMSLGGITVPSFVTNNVVDNEFIINDCLPRFIVLENEKIFEKNKKFLNKFTAKIILIENSQNFVNYKKITSIKFKEIKNVEVKREDISSIIYTSGTTGNQKGVVLTHKSVMHNLKGAIELISDFNLKNERFFSFYLCHILMKEWSVYIFQY